MALRIVVGEDDLLVREGIVRLLSGAPDLDVVASGEDYDAVLAAVDKEDPDVVVTDIKMPPTSTDEGIRLAAELRASHPKVGVVVLSQYSEPDLVLSVFEEGSDRRAYLLKERLHDRATRRRQFAPSPQADRRSIQRSSTSSFICDLAERTLRLRS